jgi:putative CocE/NonD family hydrolase
MSATETPIDPGQQLHPAFARRSDRSWYVTMRDGARIAVSAYFPDGTPPSEPVTTMLVQTRYGRATAMADPRVQQFLDSGRIVTALDTRGSTASFGLRHTDLGPEEQADMDELITHLAAQPWSNGKIIGIGTSYAADTADMATSRPAAGLAGAIPMQADFDVYRNLFCPGGVVNTGFILLWGQLTRRMDLGQSLDGSTLDGRLRREDIPGLYPFFQPVDEDTDCALAHASLQEKQRWLPQDWIGTSFRDDPGCNGHSLFGSSPASAIAGIRREAKPVQYWGSWMDAGTADSALTRFNAAPEVPMEVWITANDHGNLSGNDPLRPHERAPCPSAEAMHAIQLRFVERIERGEQVPRMIHYLVMGTDEFRASPDWPPQGMVQTRFHFETAGDLTRNPGAAGIDSKIVDLAASTGPFSRWTGQYGAGAADYQDRAVADASLMTYDSDPFDIDMELAGIPVIALEVAAQSTDPAFFVYLEDVAPDGRVTFLTEGQFRAIHRKLAAPADLPYDEGPAAHSFARRDMLEVSPGERLRVEFALSSVAALIRAGHRLRVAIAGADTHMFQTYSNGGPDRFDVFCGDGGSTVTVPLRPW